jgi:hypothetical protein
MILVHLPQSWPQVLAGMRTAEEVTLGSWAKVSDAAIAEYGDAVLGIHKNTVVSAFDITGHGRGADDRVTFRGHPSPAWGHLVGGPNPGRTWVRGQARPVQYLDTATLESGDAAVEEVPEGRRAVIDGITLTVADDGSAVLLLPTGRQLQVIAVSSRD